MKKLSFTMKFIVAFIVATFAVAMCIRYDATDNVVVCTYFGVTLMVMLSLGAFNPKGSEELRAKSEETMANAVKRKSYGQAAVFMGTAAIFVGSLAECEDVCDDLWHYGQQAHVELMQ